MCMKMGRYKKLGKNVIIITIGSFTTKLLSFFMLPLYTAFLSKNEYGTVDLITTTVNLLYPVFSLLMSEAVMRFSLDKGKNKKQVFSIGIFVTIGGFLIMLLLSSFMLLSSSVNIRQLYVYFLAYYLFSTIQLVMAQFVKGIDKVWIFSVAGIMHTLCAIVLNILFLVILKMGVKGYLLSMILSSLFTIVVLWIGADLYKYLITLKKVDRKLLREMCHYTLPMLPNSLSWWISNSSDKYMITLMSGVGVTGLYSVAQKIPSMCSIISSIFINAWQISAVDDFGSRESKKFFTNIYRQYSSLNIMAVSALICGSRILADILFSNEFYKGWMYVPILLVAYYFNAGSTFLGTIYTSAKQTKMLFISTMIAAIVNIALNLVLIPVMGAMGAAIATLVSYFVTWLVRLINTRRIMIIDVNYRTDLCSLGLIVVQIVLMVRDSTSGFWACCGIFVVVVVINKKFVHQLLCLMKNFLGQRKGRN